ncbi:MAG: sugar porter family MFS transporter [Alistipes sp.]|nr:sugar porter family MFS transporter [Alistipes sp.]
MKRFNMLYILLISLVSAMGGLLFGYDWVVIGGAKIFYEPFFGLEGLAAMRGWAMSCALVGCLAGALLAGMWCDRYGRKKMLIIASVLFTVSAVGVGSANGFTEFILSRIVGGFGIGIASNVSPIYIAEVTPASIRGRFVSLNQLTIVLGILAAQIVNWAIARHFTVGGETLNPQSLEWAWRWMFWVGAVPAIIFFGLSFVIPESPRWLALNGREQSARRIFTRIGGEEYAVKALEEIEMLKGGAGERVSLSKIFHPSYRRVIILCVVLAVFQQWCGINVIFNYAHEIFSAAGYAVSDVLMNIVVTGVTNVIFTLVAVYTVDRWGRRVLMTAGSAALAVIYAILGTAYYFEESGWTMLLLVVLAIAAYAMSLAPIVWVVLSEIFPAKMRGAMMALSTFCLWAASFLLTYTFPLLNEWLKASGTFWVYGGICLAGFFFIRSYLPETKGKSLEQIEKEITK